MNVRRAALGEAERGLWCRIDVAPGMSAGISLAAAGDMALSRDSSLPWRSRLCGRVGIPRDRLYGARQVHSRRVLVVEEQPAAWIAAEQADGLLSRSGDAVLSVTVADCLPIYLADRRGAAFGIVHSGWKGTGIVAEAVRLLESRFGVRPADIEAIIGPGIGSCCYTVPADRAALFRERYGEAAVVEGGPAPRLDLREANLVLLREAGVRDVTVVSDCTACSARLGSFRREGPEAYTLMLAWIGRAAAAGHA